MARPHSGSLALPLLGGVLILSAFLGWWLWKNGRSPAQPSTPQRPDLFGGLVETSPTPTPTPSPSPSPTPLSFADMNRLYGPCATVPVLMYHHIQTAQKAAERGQQSLTVQTSIFEQHLAYLQDRGYNPISPRELAAFFDSGASLPSKPVVLTFDDGYDNFVSDAVPLLRAYDFPAVLYLSTGLAENPTYLRWNDLKDAIAGSKIEIENHTWSHRNMKATLETISYEVGTAHNQLIDHGYGSGKSFAYPYGITSPTAVTYLTQNNYSLAFTTEPGRVQCKQKRFLLPRIRVGNSSLSAYGL